MKEGRNNFFLLPNKAIDELGVFELRLYSHYERVCQQSEDGLCRETIQQSALATKMSTGAVSKTRHWLLTKGWIFAQYGNHQQDTPVISVSPIENNHAPTPQDNGYVYVMSTGDGQFKIGKSKNPTARRARLQQGIGRPLGIIYLAQFKRCNKIEQFLHTVLASYRSYGEWFTLPPEKLEYVLSGQWLDYSGLRSECLSEERLT